MSSMELFTGQVQFVGTMPQLPSTEQLGAYFISSTLSEHMKVTAVADASLTQQVNKGWRIYPTTVLSERMRMLNTVMTQAKGMIDEISSASTLKDDIDKGQELLKGFTEVFSGKAPQAARFKVSDLRAVLKGTTSEYVDVPMNQEP